MIKVGSEKNKFHEPRSPTLDMPGDTQLPRNKKCGYVVGLMKEGKGRKLPINQ